MVKLYNYSNESITLPLTMSLTTFNRGRRVPIVEIMSGGGVLSGLEKPETREFSINGTIYYESYGEMRAFFDELLVFLEDSPIRIYQDETDSKFIMARCVNINDTWLDGRAELKLDISFIAGDPYFYSDEHIDSQTINSISKTFSLFVGGNISSFPAMILNKNSGAIKNLTITNTKNGNKIAFSDTIDTNIVINHKDLMVTSGTTSLLSAVNTDWLINSIKLEPGENVIKVTGSGTYDFSLITKWRSKWL